MLDLELCVHTWFLGVSVEEDAHWVCLFFRRFDVGHIFASKTFYVHLVVFDLRGGLYGLSIKSLILEMGGYHLLVACLIT